MKTKITIATYKCDFCRKRMDWPEKCLKCGKEACCECSTTRGITYAHRVYFQGSGDGWYCDKCDAELRSRMANGLPQDPIHKAFLAIRDFRDRIESQNESNKKEMAVLEDRLAKINPNK